MSLPSLRSAFAAGAVVVLAVAGCSRAQSSTLPLPAGVRAGKWEDLFAGGADKHWRGYRLDTLPKAWAYDAATNTLSRTRMGGDIVTRGEYTDFEFEIDWKVPPKGNNGIFYHATEATGIIYENAPEMQVLDNGGHPDGKNPLTSAGANYALDAPIRDVTMPVGEWNHARVVAVGAHVEHWLNGVKVVEYELWTPEWTAKVAKSKFAQWPTYGLAKRGHIGLQEHGDVVWFRNARIRELTR